MLPQVLKVDAAGFPQVWIDYKEYCSYKTKDLVLWEMNTTGDVVRGGTSAATGLRSQIELTSIFAVKGPVRDPALKKVPLNSTYLFRRDRYVCAYCGNVFSKESLTKDHIHPKSRGGGDDWENIVTACRACNSKKDDRTPEEAKMPLLYVPYAPSYAEYLILRNRRILADQMEFLLEQVPKKRRALYENVGIQQTTRA